MRVAARLTGDAFPRRAFAGVEQSGATGAYSGRGLAMEHQRGMRNPLAGSDGRLLALLKYLFYPLFILDNGMNLISKSQTILTPA